MNNTAKTMEIDLMSINNLIFRIAKKYGITALGEDLGINTNTFKNKINPNIDTHHVYAHELDLIATLADTDEIANYFADQRGLMCIKKPSFDGISDQAIYDLSLISQEKSGDYAKVIREAISDGEIDFEESSLIRKKYLELLAAQQEHQNKLDSFMAVCEEKKSARAKKK